MRMDFIAQSIYSYGIGSWGGAYNIHLNSLETTINSLIKISFTKPYRMSTELLNKECNLLNLNQLYARHLLSNMFFLDVQKFKFKHNYCTRTKQTNMYLIHSCRTEFRKRNPLNAGVKMAMEFNIDVGLFKVFKL